MIMNAVVIEVQPGRLLVLDLDTRQRVVVNSPEAWRWRPGELIRIWYDGVMTRSIPPQITALGIAAAPQFGLLPVIRPPVIRPPVVLPPPPPPIVIPPVVRPPAPPPRPRPPRPPRPNPRPR